MIIFRLKHGQKVVESITNKVQNIKSGMIFGLGALDEATLKLYNLKSKLYAKKKVKGPLEVGSFTALIAQNPDGKIGIHPHIVVSGRDFISYSGHLEEAIVGATFEAVVIEDKKILKRYSDLEIGLNLLED